MENIRDKKTGKVWFLFGNQAFPFVSSKFELDFFSWWRLLNYFAAWAEICINCNQSHAAGATLGGEGC